MPTHLGYETPCGLKCAIHPCDYRIAILLHPMQRGVRKNSVDLLGKLQVPAFHHACVEAALACRSDHVRRGIYAHDDRPRRRDFFREHAIAAAQVENAFSRLRFEQLEYWRSERRHKVRVLRIAIGFPVLTRFARRFHLILSPSSLDSWSFIYSTPMHFRKRETCLPARSRYAIRA